MESKNELVRKEQCPSCAKLGKDNSKDHLAVYSDGQTHCFSCGEHGFVEHSKSPVQIKEKQDDSWKHEYRGDYYSLPDRKLRGETLERYHVKCEKDSKGKIIKK